MAAPAVQPDFDKRGGFVPAVVQDVATREVLMVASMNAEAWNHTLATGRATFWSTSRNELWEKGLTSGDVLEVAEIRVDCDLDSVLLLVRPTGGGACHTRNAAGRTRTSCFYRRLSDDGSTLITLEP